jgi:hypothetical protein
MIPSMTRPSSRRSQLPGKRLKVTGNDGDCFADEDLSCYFYKRIVELQGRSKKLIRAP